MVQHGRFLSPFEKDQRSSVLEYASAERIKKSNDVSISEKVIFLRICTLPFDKILSILQYVVERIGGQFHYNLSYCLISVNL